MCLSFWQSHWKTCFLSSSPPPGTPEALEIGNSQAGNLEQPWNMSEITKSKPCKVIRHLGEMVFQFNSLRNVQTNDHHFCLTSLWPQEPYLKLNCWKQLYTRSSPMIKLVLLAIATHSVISRLDHALNLWLKNGIIIFL